MSTDSHCERIAATIRISSRPLDDDQVAARTGISPRQKVNQICHSLERAGMVRRRPGPDGKIVNEWLGDHDHEPGSILGPASAAVLAKGAPADPAAALNGAVPAGDSAEQHGAERVMLDLLGSQLGLELNPATIAIPSGERVEVDGADANRTVLVECWAHQGPPKSAQKHKVLADAFKIEHRNRRSARTGVSVLRVVHDEHGGVIGIEHVLAVKSPARRSRAGPGVQGVAEMVSLSR